MSGFLFPLAGLSGPTPLPPEGGSAAARPGSAAATPANFAALLGLALVPTPKLSGTAREPSAPALAGEAAAPAEEATAAGEPVAQGWTDAAELGLTVGRALARPAQLPADPDASRTAEPEGVSAAAEAPTEKTETEPTEAHAEIASVATPVEPLPAPENVHSVERARDELNPVFNARLERVIERMKQEWGHDVRVVETHRSQERQDFLYAQGRSRPGPVVTWTRSSKHTQGRAADLLIDGRYDNAVGYARLARIAAEEGLRTLGARDPGHIELPGRGAAPLVREGVGASALLDTAADAGARPAAAERSAPARPASAPLAAMPGGIARVAEVARVADVARVAQVAQVAVPGGAAPTRMPAPTAGDAVPHEGVTVVDASSAHPPAERATAAPDRSATLTTTAAPVAQGRSGREAGEQGSREQSDESKAELRVEGSRADLERPMPPLHTAARPEAAAGREPVAGVVGTDALERISRIRELQHDAAGGPVSHVTLQVDAPEGGQDRIRIDLRGSAIETTIDLQDPAAAERLRNRAGELQGALERHGLEPEPVRIRSAAEVAGSVASAAEGELARAGSSGKSQSDSTPQRERAGAKDWEEAREDSSRHRSRREQHEEKRK